MHRILWLLAGAVVLIDIIWAATVHFDIDRRGYLFVTEVGAGVGALAVFYGRVRRDERLCAMLGGTAFLVVFSAAFALMNYMLLTVAGPRIDRQLATLDRAMGFHWVSVMIFMAHHRVLNFLLQCFYGSLLPQIALLVLVLGWAGQRGDVFRFCLSVAIGAFVTVLFWTLFPSFGAFSVYRLPAGVEAHLSLALDRHYADDLVHLLVFGPGWISPDSIRGLIGFPSFHAALAVMAGWYAAQIRYLGWPAALLNAGVLVATPIQGGHHLVDVIGGVAVAAFAIVSSARVASAVQQSDGVGNSVRPAVAGQTVPG